MKKTANYSILYLLSFFLTAFVSSGTVWGEGPLYLQFQPKETSRVRENTEWSNFRANSATNEDLPRVLLIGDSIVAGYQGNVTQKLRGKMNVSFWASSKCVTDSQYFQELDLVLSADKYDVISFNNGLHSLTTDRKEWEFAYTQAVKFIRAKCPDARLYLTTSTPLKDPKMTAQAQELNAIVWKTAEAEKLPVIDLFSLMDPLDRNQYWSDTYHYRAPGIELEAAKIAETVAPAEK